MTDAFKVGCFLMIVCAIGLEVIIPLAVQKYQNEGLQERIELLERRAGAPWNEILAREYGRLREGRAP